MSTKKFEDDIAYLTDSKTDHGKLIILYLKILMFLIKLDSDDESLFLGNKNTKKFKTKYSYKKSLSNFPTILFFSGLLIVSLVIFKFTPHLYNNTTNLSQSLKDRFKIKYFSQVFSELFELGKMLIILNQIFLGFTFTCVFIFIKQGISNDEFSSSKYQRLLLIVFSTIAVVCLISLTFYQELTSVISRNHTGN